MNFASSTIMPLLARLILASAMLTSGWMNCFGQVQIRQEIADGLRALDVTFNEVADSDATQVDEPEVNEGSSVTTSIEGSALATQQAAGTQTTKGVNRILWLVHKTWPDIGGWGAFLAWSVCVLQLLTAVLLVVGFYTRISALCITAILLAAMYVVSAQIHGMFSMNPFDWPHDSHRFIQFYAGVGLATLSLWIMFSGAGRFSLDYKHTRTSATPAKKNTE